MDPNATPEEVARHAIAQGPAGLPYHYLVTGDGAAYQTAAARRRGPTSRGWRPWTRTRSASRSAATSTWPSRPTVQMERALRLLAELLAELGFGVNDIYGRSELEGGTSSPGMQWSQGVRWRDDLVSLVAARLPETVVE